MMDARSIPMLGLNDEMLQYWRNLLAQYEAWIAQLSTPDGVPGVIADLEGRAALMRDSIAQAVSGDLPS